MGGSGWVSPIYLALLLICVVLAYILRLSVPCKIKTSLWTNINYVSAKVSIKMLILLDIGSYKTLGVITFGYVLNFLMLLVAVVSLLFMFYSAFLLMCPSHCKKIIIRMIHFLTLNFISL